MTPPSLERLVRRCLAKDPDDRWDTAHDVAAELRWVAEIGGQVSAPEATPPRARSTVIWVLSVVVAAALGALVASWVGEPSRSNGTMVATPFHAVIELPDDIPLAIGERPQMGSGPSVTVSPDGSMVVYVGETSEGQQLYLRPMNSYEVTPIPGTEGGARPFFSPDGRWVGFLTTDKVKKVSLQGGAPLTLCDARSPVRARWTRDDMIFFMDNQGTSVSRVPAAGGVPVALQPSQALIARVSQVLPDGKWALQSFPDGISSDHASIRLVSLDTGETRELVKSGFDARYVPTGHLIFARSGNLLAVPFDLDRLQVVGEAVPVVSNVSMEPLTGAAQQVAESDSGTLVYVPGGDTSVGKLAWVDRQGTPEFLPVPERQYGAVDLAPGGGRLAVHVADVNDYIWIYDITREEGRKLRTTEGAGWPVWTPDGKDVAFSTTGEGLRGILKQAVDDAGPPVELSRSAVGYPQSWSPDGAVLAERARRAQGAVSVIFHRLDGEPGPEWSRPAGSDAWGHVFSPDGRWVAYASDETGRYEIWVRSYPEGDTARQISVEGGIEPLWCDDCDELFFRKGNRWMSSTVTLGPELSWETPRLAFETEFVDTPGRSYDVSADGQRLLVVKSTREPVRTKLHVIQNWFTELNRLVPVN
jgi:serine/threonine-protein kinase